MVSTAVANPASTLTTLVTQLAGRLNLGADPRELIETLKQTAFRTKEPVTDAQLTALLVVAQEYRLNPFTKELHAFPSERGIVPIVGIDGWIRIINEHPQFDGMEFDYEPTEVSCRIWRKDRSKPTEITEYLEECRRGTDPWKNMPRRMLRHKAIIQCARVAFGFALYDEEEGATAAGLVIDNETGEIFEPTARGPKRKSAANVEGADARGSAETKPPAGETKPASGETSGTPSTPPPPPANANAGSGVTGNQVAYLRNKLKAANIGEQTICDRFTVASIESLSGEQFDLLKAELLNLT